MGRARKKANPRDALALVERVLKVATDAGVKTVDVNLALLRTVVELAKNAPKPRGGHVLTGRERVAEKTVLALARARKKQLMAQGKTAGEAAESAAKEASKRLKSLSGRNVAPSTIERRMQDRH